jgi:hypothetical protein
LRLQLLDDFVPGGNLLLQPQHLLAFLKIFFLQLKDIILYFFGEFNWVRRTTYLKFSFRGIDDENFFVRLQNFHDTLVLLQASVD